MRGYFLARAARREDVEPLADRLRVGDRLEIERWGCGSPGEALRESYLASSRAWTAEAPDGEPVAMWGVTGTPGPNALGVVWLMGSERVREDIGDFLRLSRRYAALMSEPYGSVGNFVDARYDGAIRWLSWLGFRRTHTVRRRGGHRFVLMIKETAE